MQERSYWFFSACIHLQIIKKLGGGAFGEVYTGIWKKKDGTVEVAVKTLKGIMHKKQRAEFMKAVSDVIASVLTYRRRLINCITV